MSAEPVRYAEELLLTAGVAGALPKVVITQAVLGDSDRVVLQADVSVIVELRNAVRVIGTLIVRLFGKEHVVLAEFVQSDVGILRGSLMPESEMAVAAEEIRAENASVVIESGQWGIESSVRLYSG